MCKLPGHHLALTLKRAQRGATALEFALVAPLFFLVLFACLEIGIMLMADAALERTANHVTRKARIELRGDCKTELLSELNKHLGGWATASPSATHIEVLHSHDENNPLSALACGGAKDVVRYHLGFERPSFFGLLGWMGIHPEYRRTVIVQNEPYEPDDD